MRPTTTSRGRAAAAAAVASALAALAAAQPTVTLMMPEAVYQFGAESAPGVLSEAIQPGITISSADPIASVVVCIAKSPIYMEDEEALVCPGAESLTPVGMTCAWDKSQTGAGGGCMTLTAPAAGVSAAAAGEIAWQVRYLNGGPANGPTTGQRTLTVTATAVGGASGTAAMTMDVQNAPALVGRCPVLGGAEGAAVDVTPQMLAGGAGVRVLPGLTAGHPAPNGTSVNAHVRIVGGCVPAQDVLALDLTSAPPAVGSTFYPATCDLTLYNVGGLPPAAWQAALRSVVYRNLAAAGAAALGPRAIAASLGSLAPSECRSNYAAARVNVLAAMPTRSPAGSPSVAASPQPTPSLSPTPIDLGALGTPTEEPAAGGASSGAGGGGGGSALAVAAALAAAVAAAVL